MRSDHHKTVWQNHKNTPNFCDNSHDDAYVFCDARPDNKDSAGGAHDARDIGMVYDRGGHDAVCNRMVYDHGGRDIGMVYGRGGHDSACNRMVYDRGAHDARDIGMVYGRGGHASVCNHMVCRGFDASVYNGMDLI
jgi:hypothetical protein